MMTGTNFIPTIHRGNYHGHFNDFNDNYHGHFNDFNDFSYSNSFTSGENNNQIHLATLGNGTSWSMHDSIPGNSSNNLQWKCFMIHHCGHIIYSFFGLCLTMVPSSSLRGSSGKKKTQLCSILTIVVILVRSNLGDLNICNKKSI